MPLREYQEEAVNALGHYWSKASKPCILQLATGAGKSWIIAEIVKRSKQPTLILQPSVEILEQNYEKLVLSGVPKDLISICSASANSWEVNQITLATIWTIKPHAKHC